MNLNEQPVNSSYIYKGRVINLRVDEALLPNGKTAKREVIEHGGGVCVAALTDQGELLTVRQFRYPYMETVVELPAGKLEKGEDPLDCGRRELKEETGASAGRFVSLGELYPSPGYCGEVIWMFAAKDVVFGKNSPDEDEFLEVERIPLDRAVEMVLSGEIKDAKTQAAVLKLNELIKRGGL